MLPSIGLVVEGKTKEFIKGQLHCIPVCRDVTYVCCQGLMSWEGETTSPQRCWSGGSAVQLSSTTLETSWSLRHRTRTRSRSHSIPRRPSENPDRTPVTLTSDMECGHRVMECGQEYLYHLQHQSLHYYCPLTLHNIIVDNMRNFYKHDSRKYTITIILFLGSTVTRCLRLLMLWAAVLRAHSTVCAGEAPQR